MGWLGHGKFLRESLIRKQSPFFTLSLGGVDKEVLSAACQSQDNTGVSASIALRDEVQVKTEPVEISDQNLADRLENVVINITDDEEEDIESHLEKLLKSGDN